MKKEDYERIIKQNHENINKLIDSLSGSKADNEYLYKTQNRKTEEFSEALNKFNKESENESC